MVKLKFAGICLDSDPVLIYRIRPKNSGSDRIQILDTLHWKIYQQGLGLKKPKSLFAVVVNNLFMRKVKDNVLNIISLVCEHGFHSH